MSGSAFRGLRRDSRRAVVANVDAGAAASTAASQASDPFTRDLARDSDGNVLLVLSGTVEKATIPGQTAATDADQVICVAPFAGKVSAVSLVPEAAVTGATATKRTFTLTNKGQDGSGSTSVAVLDLVTGTDLVAFDEKAFTLSGTAADLNVAKGDVLVLVETHASTGTAHSGGQVRVQFSVA